MTIVPYWCGGYTFLQKAVSFWWWGGFSHVEHCRRIFIPCRSADIL